MFAEIPKIGMSPTTVRSVIGAPVPGLVLCTEKPFRAVYNKVFYSIVLAFCEIVNVVQEVVKYSDFCCFVDTVGA